MSDERVQGQPAAGPAAVQQPETLTKSLEPYRLQWLADNNFLRRRLLFLDLNFWIRLAAPPDSQFRALGDSIREAVEAGILLCPVTPTVVMELEKLGPGTQRDSRADVMQALSQGLALRAYPLIIADEFARVYLGQSLERAIAYSCIWNAFDGSPQALPWALDFTGTGMTADQMETITAQIFPMIASFTIRAMLDAPQFVDSRTARLETVHRDLEQACSKEEKARANTTRQSIREAEFIGTFNSIQPALLVRFSGLLRDGLMSELRRQQDGTPVALRQILDECPTFWCHYQLGAALRSSVKRQLQPNDLWDIQHLTAALHYVDCIATDRAMRHLCNAELKIGKRYGTVVVAQPKELQDWLVQG